MTFNPAFREDTHRKQHVRPRLRPTCLLAAAIAIPVVVILGIAGYRRTLPGALRSAHVLAWIREPGAHPDWALPSGLRCGSAPFIFPTQGFAGYLWDDSFRLFQRHQGIDIFGEQPGRTPVVAAYPGYLTRLPDWKSSVILRIPHDPLQPERQVWLYYTHMADENGASFIASEFPPGTREAFVEAGRLLGYQGNYSGEPGNPVGVHLHFSIVLDDGKGSFRNELEFHNTLDPSPYLGLPLNAHHNRGEVPRCEALP